MTVLEVIISFTGDPETSIMIRYKSYLVVFTSDCAGRLEHNYKRLKTYSK